MKITFISSQFNHHQKFVSDQLYELTNHNYHFIAQKGIPRAMINFGYEQFSNIDYVVNTFEHEQGKYQALIDQSDVTIVGGSASNLLDKRISQKKLVFRYSERPLKKGFQFWKYPYRFIKWRILNPQNAPIYLLCASAYTAPDYAKFGMFKDKMLKWGYFPECIRYDDFSNLMANKNRREILWCGRMIDWKHPDDVVKLAKALKNEGYNFHIKMIGSGAMSETLKRLIIKYGVDDCVSIVESISSKKIRVEMQKSGIYLMTSDRKEGWGVVVNEAMNSGCAVVGSDEAGSVPFLIKNKENGLIYHSGNFGELCDCVRKLLDFPETQIQLGYKAYDTIITEWNAKVAAERLVKVSEKILNNEDYSNLFSEGPCSVAHTDVKKILKQCLIKE